MGWPACRSRNYLGKIIDKICYNLLSQKSTIPIPITSPLVGSLFSVQHSGRGGKSPGKAIIMIPVPEVPLPNTRTKIFALDGMPEISTFFTFLKTRRHGVEMENGIEPKRTISLTWDDPWKKYEERWKKHPRGEGKPLLYSGISRTERSRRSKPKFRKTKSFKAWRESMETLSLVDKRIDVWLKD